MPSRARKAPPVRPRIVDARRYEGQLRQDVLRPLHAAIQRRLREAGQNYAAIRNAIAAIPNDPSLQGLGTAAAQAQANRLKAYQRRRFRQIMSRTIGVDIGPLMPDLGVETIIRGNIADNVALIRTMPERAKAKFLQDMLALSEAAPFDEHALSKILADTYGYTGYQLRRIARDQNNKLIGNLNEARQRQVGISEYEWGTSEDERVRPTHRENDGRRFSWDDPPPTGHPGFEVQCFPPSIGIAPAGLHGSVSYRYVGPLIQIVLANGVDVTTTPNHPILTEAGWKGAADVQEGDKLLHHEGGRGFAAPPLYPQFGDGNPIAEQLHVLFGGLRSLHRAHGRSLDLHGAPASRDEEINVVEPDRALREEMESIGRKMFGNIIFEHADYMLAGRGLGAHSAGAADIPASLVGVAHQILSFLFGHAGVAQAVGLAAAAPGQPHVPQAMLYGSALDPQFPRHAENRFPGVPALANFREMLRARTWGELGRVRDQGKIVPARAHKFVSNAKAGGSLIDGKALFPRLIGSGMEGYAGFQPVRVSRVISHDYDGPVYSFESDTGLIVANNVVTHNCRCVAFAIITDERRSQIRSMPFREVRA